ncbi:ABC transporter substrate-binding protein [Thalassospira lucentensis]|uniref:ABC transporter substrate-binding protein n=1 Tax=Thalassospira lucentensis TaxID=168935 RepID=UPI0003FF2764|nr:ABC transporter substrate-binding protein [Thalassospira lucentensis]
MSRFSRIGWGAVPWFFVLLASSGHANVQVKLHVWSATDTSAVEPFIESFEASYPSIDVVYREFNTSELFQVVMYNIDNPKMEADVVISPAMDLQVKLVNEGLAYRFDAENADAIPNWAQWRNELYGFSFEPAALVYNKKALAGVKAPVSHTDLSNLVRDNPEMFSGKIGTYNIRQSGIGYFFATQDAIQNNQTSRLTESFGRAGARLYCCSSEILDRVATGELVLGYNVIGSYAIAAAEQNPGIGVYFLRDYTITMSRTAFIPNTSQAKHQAKMFIDFLLSREGQQVLADESALIPINQDVETVLTPHLENIPVFRVKLGIGLLGFQDELKKNSFLDDWESSILWSGGQK